MNRERETPGLLFPLLLIGAGAALLAEQLGLFSIHWGMLARLWPLLLVLFGLEALFKALRAPALVASSVALVITLVAGLVFGPLVYPTLESGQLVYSYPAEGASSAEINLKPAVANIRVDATSREAAVEVDITAPQGTEHLAAEQERRDGRLVVRITETDAGPRVPFMDEETTARWNISLDPTMPTELALDTGVGRTTLALREAELLGLRLDGGVGSVTADLAGGEYTASLHLGIGSIELSLPEDVAACIRTDSGLGRTTASSRYQLIDGCYVTPTYSADAPAVEIEVSTGIGAIILK